MLQPDYNYINLSELRTMDNFSPFGSKVYSHLGLICHVQKNQFYVLIEYDISYEVIMLYMDCLENKFGLTLENSYGITDITQIYSYNENTFYLQYLSYGGETIEFSVDIKDEKIRVIATIQSYEVTKSTGIGAALMGVPVQKYGVVEYVPSECFPYTKKEKGTGSKAITLAHCWIVSCFEQLNDAVNHGITGLESDDF